MHGISLALALLAIAPSPAAPQRLPPAQECANDPSFGDFRERLRVAVARRDRDALLPLFASDVLLSFGGSSGRDELLKEWEFDAAEPDNIWNQLETMLKLGCARSGESRVIPSLSAQIGSDDEDVPFDSVLILPGAMLYQGAGEESQKPETIPWTVAAVTSRAADWGTGVRLPDGREGYVPDDYVYEPLGYRLVMEKRDGQWMITAFVAGD